MCPNARHRQENRRHCREGQLEPGVEDGDRTPHEKHESAERESVPAVGASRRKDCDARDSPGNSGSGDRRLPADRQRVREDPGDRHDLHAEPPHGEQPRQTRETECDDRDVLARDGSQVCQSRGAEVVSQRRGQIPVVSEHDPAEEREMLPFGAAGERSLDVRAQPIGDASDPTPPADDIHVLDAEDDMNASTLQPRTFVEAGLGSTRRPRPRAHDLQDRPSGRRPLVRELEQHVLMDVLGAEPPNVREHAH